MFSNIYQSNFRRAKKKQKKHIPVVWFLKFHLWGVMLWCFEIQFCVMLFSFITNNVCMGYGVYIMYNVYIVYDVLFQTKSLCALFMMCTSCITCALFMVCISCITCALCMTCTSCITCALNKFDSGFATLMFSGSRAIWKFSFLETHQLKRIQIL